MYPEVAKEDSSAKSAAPKDSKAKDSLAKDGNGLCHSFPANGTRCREDVRRISSEKERFMLVSIKLPQGG